MREIIASIYDVYQLQRHKKSRINIRLTSHCHDFEMFHSFNPSFARTHFRMAVCASVGVAGIAGNSSWFVNGDQIAFTWQ